MLATFVIGLREGLEAALIVGIIATFLRSNGRSLVPMWVGVAAAVALSLAVGVGLAIVGGALPQAAQEGLETVIGAIAVVFVAGMVVWMTGHARSLKSSLEQEAAEALDRGGAFALAAMAFLAVLREGFETSVFLLATFSASTSAVAAAAGAILGIAVAVGVGWAIYAGGLRLNLARFFGITGAFILLVAAGLVLSTLRTAHEAGWLTAGQERTVDLSWLVAPGSIQSALITGVLGIPADPRVVEVLGWVLFVVPMALYVYWPARRRLAGVAAARLEFTLAGVLLIVAMCLAVFVPAPAAVTTTSVGLVRAGDGTSIGTARVEAAGAGGIEEVVVDLGAAGSIVVPMSAAAAHQQEYSGRSARSWTVDQTGAPEDAPATLSLTDVVQLGGGRLPLGVNAQANPGPFDARWSTHRNAVVTMLSDAVVDVTAGVTTVVTLSGGGLPAPRTFTPTDADVDAVTAPGHVEEVLTALTAAEIAAADRALWGVQLPIALALVAILLGVLGTRHLRSARSGDPSTADDAGSSEESEALTARTATH